MTKRKKSQFSSKGQTCDKSQLYSAGLLESYSGFLPLAPPVNPATRFYTSLPPKHIHTHTLPQELGDPKRFATGVMFFSTTFQQPAGSKASSGSLLHKQTAFSSSIRHISSTLLFSNTKIKQVCEHPFIPEQIPACAQTGQSCGGEHQCLMSYRKYSDKTVESVE